VDSANDYIRRKYLHAQQGMPIRMNDKTAIFSRLRLAVLAFNIAASIALVAYAVMVVLS
jgi:hypothetical protein